METDYRNYSKKELWEAFNALSFKVHAHKVNDKLFDLPGVEFELFLVEKEVVLEVYNKIVKDSD